MLFPIAAKDWNTAFAPDIQTKATQRLENGQILFLPELAFSLLQDEKHFLSTQHADPKTKNISYHAERDKLWGVQRLTDSEHAQLKAFLSRYSHYANCLIKQLLPHYTGHLVMARTSFRPIQVSDRKSSYRKDDKRLHVDAFPSAPNQGKRILRVFCNINPNGEDRIWRVGEPFEKVADRFLPEIKKPWQGYARLLRLLKITKSYRTPYDHYMLNMHDKMKADDDYQRKANQQEVRFPPGSAWIVQTDHVSHAAMQGQYVLEQTFYLPVEAMQDPALSPLKVLEKRLSRPLIY
ncbi:MAG: hypothetical protein A3F14_03935 [Gammaproteobacteria bacterium RIFCSPHIGHO2_12_FULL_43_28]|nr:MAG: hypothetical protein A3F14_03935 [Gammaproteobacteria bacterium RIFCSPHIGHO2_12_FULL_43_28]